MKTYNVTIAHGTDIQFSGNRISVKQFISAQKMNHNLDPEHWDVLIEGNRIKRVMGADFIETGYKFD